MFYRFPKLNERKRQVTSVTKIGSTVFDVKFMNYLVLDPSGSLKITGIGYKQANRNREHAVVFKPR